MDRRHIITVTFFTLLLVVCLIFMVLGLQSATNTREDYKEFMETEHTCPKCGWHGYPGLMKSEGNAYRTVVDYYCPNCGWQLYHYRM